MSYSAARDKQIADAHVDTSQSMCAAHGCPNCWAIQSSKLCSWHHWAAPNDWPRVTEEMQFAATERAIERSKPPLATTPLSAQEKTGILQRLRSVLANQKLGRSA